MPPQWIGEGHLLKHELAVTPDDCLYVAEIAGDPSFLPLLQDLQSVTQQRCDTGAPVPRQQRRRDCQGRGPRSPGGTQKAESGDRLTGPDG